MALTPTTFSTGYKSGTSHGTGVYTTPSFTPSDNQLLVVFLTYWKAFGGGSADPLRATISDSVGLTWKFLGRVWLTADAPLGICIYTAEVTTGTSMTISVDNGAVNVSSYHVHVLGFTDYRTFNPIDMIVGSGTTSTGDGAETQTLRDAPASADYTYIHLAVDCNGTVANPTWSGFTQDYQTNSGSDFGVACTSHRTGSTSTTCAVTDVYTGGSTYFKSAMVSLIVRDKDTPIAPIFVGAGAGLTTITDGGNITPALPVDPITSASMPWLEDDVGFVLVGTNQNNAPTIGGSGDWTEESGFAQADAAQSTKLWWRRLVGGDSAQAVTDGGTTALSSSNQMSGRLYVYRNCIDTGTPFEDATASGNTSTETTPDTAAIDTTGDNRRAVCLYVIDDDSAYSSGNPPSGWVNEVADYTNTTGGDMRLGIMGQYVASASTVASAVIGTLSTGEVWRADTLALIPFSAAGGDVTITAIPAAAAAAGIVPVPLLQIPAVLAAATGAGVAPNPSLSVAPLLASAIAAGIAPVPAVAIPATLAAAIAAAIPPIVITGSFTTVSAVPAAAAAAGVAPIPVLVLLPPIAAANAQGIAPAPLVAILPPSAQATAAGISPVPVIRVLAPLAAAVAAGIVPTIVKTGNVAINAVPALAMALGIAPVIVKTGNATIIAVPAFAAAAGVAPTPVLILLPPRTSATAAGIAPVPKLAVVAFPAAATAAGIAPIIIAQKNRTVLAAVAQAVAAGIVPVFLGQVGIIVDYFDASDPDGDTRGVPVALIFAGAPKGELHGQPAEQGFAAAAPGGRMG